MAESEVDSDELNDDFEDIKVKNLGHFEVQ